MSYCELGGGISYFLAESFDVVICPYRNFYKQSVGEIMKTRNLSVCLGVALLAFGSGAQAIVIDKYFTVNPIRVCDNAGNNCTTANTFTEQTEKIYTQTGVAPVFLPVTQINNTAMLNVPSVTTLDVPGNGQSADPSTIN